MSSSSGVVIVDKPSAVTSHQVVGRLRRLLGTRKIGHAGTLDPMATGVLILGVNRATRLLGHLALHDKRYLATVRLGASSNTDDADGEVVAIADASGLTRDDVDAALGPQRGDILQVPTAVSAIKVDGKRAYALARAGEQVELKARPVTVSRLDVLDVRPSDGLLDVDLDVECSSGTYVRAIARDLGAALGVGGHLTALRRTRIGGYSLDDAVTLGDEPPALMSMADAARISFPVIELTDDQARDVGFGRPLALPVPANPTGLIAPSGELLALYRPTDTGSRPVAVLGVTVPHLAIVGDRTQQTIVVIGNFDGVHRGHQKVLAEACRDVDLPLTVVTFWPHPVSVLRPEQAPKLLTDLRTRIDLLKHAGAHEVRVIRFGPEVAAMSPEEFVDRFLVPLHPARIVVGENFRFGARAAGDVGTLVRLGEGRFEVRHLALEAVDAKVSCSTGIRAALEEGDVAEAARHLGRPFRYRGVVVVGDQRGRELGFPTANLTVPREMAVPADGVYAGWVTVLDEPGAEPMAAAISVGTNPTFDGADRRVESYVLDRTDLELYGSEIAVDFVARLRGQVRFDGIEALIAQMGADVEESRRILSAR